LCDQEYYNTKTPCQPRGFVYFSMQFKTALKTKNIPIYTTPNIKQY